MSGFHLVVTLKEQIIIINYCYFHSKWLRLKFELWAGGVWSHGCLQEPDFRDICRFILLIFCLFCNVGSSLQGGLHTSSRGASTVCNWSGRTRGPLLGCSITLCWCFLTSSHIHLHYSYPYIFHCISWGLLSYSSSSGFATIVWWRIL